MTVRRATAEDMGAVHELRYTVFVVAQGVPVQREQDGLDDTCEHLVAEVEGQIVGTTRLNWKADALKVERVAVHPDHRGQGLGVALMHAAHVAARERGLHQVVLHAQESVVQFYEQLGYVAEGEPHLDAGIVHRSMRRVL